MSNGWLWVKTISRWILTFLVICSISGFDIISSIAANPDSTPSAPATECPVFEITSKFSIAYGDVTINASDAPVDTIVLAKSPRGDVVGCFIVTTSGKFGAMYVYGEDTSVLPALPGMRDGEVVAFYVGGISAVSTPSLIWHDDKELHEVDLSATGQTAPTADFTATPTSGYQPLNVQFTDLSSGAVTSWYWSFGDGGTSTLQHPSHNYTQVGSFTVALTVTGPGGSDSKTRTSYINVVAGEPSADFTASPLSGVAPLLVTFTNLSTNYSVSLWSFGDNTSSSQTNPTHTYTQKGLYSVSLAVLGPGGSDTKNKADYIQVYAQVQAEFTYDKTSGQVPLTVQFTNQSTGDWTSLSWDFGDGSSSNLVNPNHTYTNPGDYTVILTASGPGGVDSEQKNNLIHVDYALPIADFTADVTSGTAPLSVQFTNTSTNATSYLWEFGDGGTSALASPSHTFTSPGTYTVTLTANGPGGSDVEKKANYIQVQGPLHATFSADVTSGNVPLTVHFTNLSSGEFTQVSWDFGDGGTSQEDNPIHVYLNAGKYTVTLTITGSNGSDQYISVDLIHVYEEFLIYLPIAQR